ncbi:MAG: HD-GYP domain-containing protein [Actinobacteria bacterium]|nr:HD-GYP domain-containing protein [Actinomycetota bacterium]
MDKDRTLTLNIYVYFVFVIGLAVAGYVLYIYRDVSVIGVVLFGVLIFAADNLSAPLPKTGSVSVNFGISLASLILFGPPTAIVVTFISIFNMREFIRRVPYYKHLFNAGQYLISMGVASVVFENIYTRDASGFFNAANIGCILAAAYIFFFLNTILTAAAISISEKINLLNVWVFNYAWLIPFQLFLAAMAVAISFLYNLYGPFTLLFTSLPLIIAQYTYLLRVKERRALLNSILQIVKIMEAKDPYTAGHSVRVAEYSEKIARKLKLNEYDTELLVNLANLHDIGKIQVDLSILNKPGHFTKKDWDEVKKHPEVGYEIVKEITFLKSEADAILHHHERVDGKGYPKGIKGDKISVFAKILAVADAYDAMTTDRPYRRALTKKEAMEEIERNLGMQFDAKIGELMIEVIREDYS